MKRNLPSFGIKPALYLILFLLINFVGNAQIIQVEIVGGAVVTQGSTITINAGNSLDFRITNIETGNCGNLRIQDIDITNTTDFDISPNNPRDRIKPAGCRGDHDLYFEVENLSPTCTTAITEVVIEIRNQPDFSFFLEVNSSPIMSIVGGSPPADVMHGDTTTSDVNGTYFGVVEEGAVVIRNFFITNTGSCPLEISSITSSLSDFVLDGFLFSPTLTPLPYTASIDPGDYAIFRVSFIGPVGGSGTLTSTISISNTDNTTYTFNVSAEMFNFNIPGPGGITADFRLWLKSTRGIVKSGSNITDWIDLGTNGKDATTDPGKEPTYMDTAAENINFNPVIKFENDGAGIEQYMYNATNGFYSQDMFIVMIPDATMTSASPRNTIFSGVSSGNAGDITGVGFGDYSSAFPNETLSYNQNIPGGGSYNGVAESGTSYSNAGIINVRNDSDIVLGGQEILYNSSVLTATSVDDIPYANVGDPGPPTVLGTEYWIGRNFDVVGSLNGRVAEVFTFAERVADADRQKIESYLAIKYGITLGTSTQVEKDYINSFNTSIWDISANTGYNYHVAGIGRDSISDLNQKQSKTLNIANEVTIGLNGIFATNSANTNEFKKDGDFLVWGSNDAAYTASGSNTVTVATGITTSLTRILRQWKIVESIEDAGGDVENVFVSIPSAVFSSFTLGADEEYALVVADNDNFANGDIIDVVPLVSDGAGNLQTWYDFDGTKYFTFAKVSKFSGNHSVSIDADGYLIGEYAINLNIDAFTISAWVKSASSANTRTIMAKGSKLQLRLNPSDQIEVMLDDDVTPRFTSTMVLNDGKWHQVTFVYKSGSIFLYVDGVLDKSEQDVEPPTPNFNRFSVGAVYIDKNNIINPFLGEIDEVYIWDQGLTQDQVRYLMNQEVERFDISGTDYVNGEVLPQASSSNEVTTIPWGDLRTYYDFNSFYGSTVEGRADVRYFLRLKYLDKDKELVDAQTIPVPYVSVANGAWDMPATWRNNADQVLPNSLSLDGVTMVNWNIVEIGHDITSGDRDIALLGLKQTAGKLTIADPVDPQDETNSGQALTVTNYLEIDGIIDLVGESQFIQTEGSVLDADSGGFIERDQQGTANGFNYNYWSSSVGPITGSTVTRGTGVSYLNNNHTIDGVLNDGTDTDLYLGIDFITNQNTGSGPPPPPGSAKEISSYWLYKFYGPEDDYFSWESIDQNTSLQAGEGFTMKGTLGAVAITDQQNYVFTGLPNNGDITLPLDKSSGDVDRLIGNPYPSAIDATEFILDNMSIANGGNNASGTIFNGALYFWDHFGEQNTHVLKGYVGGYATYNLTGGAAAISNDVRINNDMSSGSKIPGQYIPVNQGFFVSTAIDGFTDDNGAVISVVDGGDIVFKNSQRVFATEQAASSIFLRDSNKSKTTGNPQNKTSNLTKSSSIRLMYSSPKGYHRQLLLGTNTNASKGFDLGYDAFMIDVNEEDMYWDIAQHKFVIQGVGNFDDTNEFPLGLIVKNSGIVKIKLEAVENLETAKTLYIKDNVTNETVLINNKPFEMFLDAGTYHDRFLLVFQSQSLTTEDVEIADNVSVYFDKSISELKVRGLNDSELLSITLFNIIGQEIKFIDYTSNKTSKQVHVNTGAYIVQLNTDKGTINKKIIIE